MIIEKTLVLRVQTNSKSDVCERIYSGVCGVAGRYKLMFPCLTGQIYIIISACI